MDADFLNLSCTIDARLCRWEPPMLFRPATGIVKRPGPKLPWIDVEIGSSPSPGGALDSARLSHSATRTSAPVLCPSSVRTDRRTKGHRFGSGAGSCGRADHTARRTDQAAMGGRGRIVCVALVVAAAARRAAAREGEPHYWPCGGYLNARGDDRQRPVLPQTPPPL